MPKLRFKIANLLAIICILSVGFAALRESSDLWESGVFTLTVGVLLISILLAVHRTAKKRALWLGFALFGSAYVGLSLLPSSQYRLITTKALVFLDSKLPRSMPAGLAYFDYDNDGSIDVIVSNHFLTSVNGTLDDLTTVPGAIPAVNPAPSFWDRLLGILPTRSSGTTENFVRIGHSLFALAVGWLGGCISRRLSTSRPEVREESVISQGST